MRYLLLALCVAGLLVSQVVTPTSASAQAGDRDHAEALARDAITAHKAGNHEAALSLFDKSLAEYDHALTRFFKARSLVALKRWEAARELYRTLLATKDALGPKNYDEAKANLARCEEMLKETAVRVTSGNAPGAVVTVDGRAVGSTPLTTKLRRGKYAIKVTKDGFEPVDRTVEVAGQTDLPVEIALKALPKAVVTPIVRPAQEAVAQPVVVAPEKPGMSSKRLWAWITAGGAVAGLAAGAGLIAQHFVQVNKEPPAGYKKDSVTPAGLISGSVLAAVGVGLGVTSAVLFLKDSTETKTSAWLVPTCGGLAAGVSGTW